MANFNDPYFPFSERQWRRFEGMARRGMGPIAERLGDLNFLDHKFKISRALASGDLRLVALYLIEQQPRHGYDLIKAIEEKSLGFYSPSPGVIYPALTYLEEAGYVTSETDGNKKAYTITEAGRAHLAGNRDAIDGTMDFLAKAGERLSQWAERGRPSDGPEGRNGHHRGHRGENAGGDRDIADVVPELNDARRELKSAMRGAIDQGPDAQRQLTQILRKAAADIAAIAPKPDAFDYDI